MSSVGIAFPDCRKPYLPPAGARAWGVPLNLLPEGEPPLVFAAARSAYGLKLLPLYPPPSLGGGGSAEPEPASLLVVKSSVLRFLPDFDELFLPAVLGLKLLPKLFCFAPPLRALLSESYSFMRSLVPASSEAEALYVALALRDQTSSLTDSA